MMNQPTYTVITFSPVQGFIEKSRKLRDLYGSSFLLSYLSYAICEAAKKRNLWVISPALLNVAQGTPNQIIIQGDFPENMAKDVFYGAWKAIVHACREDIEKRLDSFSYAWEREWKTWGNHAWEFFWAQSNEQDWVEDSSVSLITHTRRKLNQRKVGRNWVGINWQGESSTLSGADAIAWPCLQNKNHPLNTSKAEQTQEIAEFYSQLSKVYGEAIIDPTERLSIPELIKRLVTLEKVALQFNSSNATLPSVEIPKSFVDLNRFENNLWTGWFAGDGDKIGEYLRNLTQQIPEGTEDGTEAEAKILNEFSQAMMDWGKAFEQFLRPFQKVRVNHEGLEADGRVIYAGGDDFLGVLYRDESQTKLTPQECLRWFYRFPEIWEQHGQKITVSVGFVWAAPGVPQRDVLQHCREAEKSAKTQGRDRIAIRILFNSGNYLEWACPWWLLDPKVSDKCPPYKPKTNLIESYRDRHQGKNWNHLYEDVATLASRHGFAGQQIDIALELIEIYFGLEWKAIIANPDHWWNRYDNDEMQIFTGILGDPKQFDPNYQESAEARVTLNKNEKVKEAFNQWVLNLANVGFHLTQDND